MSALNRGTDSPSHNPFVSPFQGRITLLGTIMCDIPRSITQGTTGEDPMAVYKKCCTMQSYCIRRSRRQNGFVPVCRGGISDGFFRLVPKIEQATQTPTPRTTGQLLRWCQRPAAANWTLEDICSVEYAILQWVLHTSYLLTGNWHPVCPLSKIGQVITFRVYNRIVVLLNDHTSVKALLDQRADMYSDRPISWMFHETCGRRNTVFNISSSDPRHRIYRRLLHSGLGRRATVKTWPSLKEQTSVMLRGFADDPQRWQQHVRRYGW